MLRGCLTDAISVSRIQCLFNMPRWTNVTAALTKFYLEFTLICFSSLPFMSRSFYATQPSVLEAVTCHLQANSTTNTSLAATATHCFYQTTE